MVRDIATPAHNTRSTTLNPMLRVSEATRVVEDNQIPVHGPTVIHTVRSDQARNPPLGETTATPPPQSRLSDEQHTVGDLHSYSQSRRAYHQDQQPQPPGATERQVSTTEA